MITRIEDLWWKVKSLERSVAEEDEEGKWRKRKPKSSRF